MIDLDRNTFAPDEAGAAAEMEHYLGGMLKRTPAGTSADYVVESGNFAGIRIDFKLTPDTFAQAEKSILILIRHFLSSRNHRG
ncbi:hypothetical protein [Pseudoduganella lutea]|uniref:CdiA C-terminal tRNase domain-containing protein n=1 Tax=Pseudoduganella lutea TaxID=321985 RepID=A0A4P6L1J3_9BURK|nr:hypothetical protein [Pseudoduganella lutea]QBE65065.1 hypothetical protein EWM63_20430 [Pseudoduganella lutea]